MHPSKHLTLVSAKNTQSSLANLAYKDPTYIFWHQLKSATPTTNSTMKTPMVPLLNTYKEYKDYKFNILTKTFQEEHPWIKVRHPRSPCDRQPPKTQRNIPNMSVRKTRKVLDKTLNKRFWKTKTKTKIINMSLELHQKIETNQYTNWSLFREHLQKLFNNPNMNIRVTMIPNPII